MTIAGLAIQKSVESEFKAMCVQHYGAGKPPVAHRARITFFARLREVHDMHRDIVPNLPAIFQQLDRWEAEVRENGRNGNGKIAA